MDAEVKRRIDAACNILIGKLPDPRSQVEQITLALLYKFMDDMDLRLERSEGARRYFVDAYAKYSWAAILQARSQPEEMLALYREGIASMASNPKVPGLFEKVFDGVYLPYDDPVTLRSFLGIMDGFVYDNSEQLGDAFEYTLSGFGYQGNAGQFRTPWHIVNFVVDIMEPQPHEVILDPSCGTAGFLISAFRHMEARGQAAQLTHANFLGYDISPDMVRLSQCNMYLHGFADPSIYEHNTLVNEARWDECADLILSNPPFISLADNVWVSSYLTSNTRRSETLFVEYIMQHMTATGRAAIILPEGVLYRTQRAETQLRRQLVNTSLVAVISLPQGVFNPYTGVKTSILVLDNRLAPRTDRVAFFKVANDGFDLTAKRNPISKNDLPKVATEVKEYMASLR